MWLKKTKNNLNGKISIRQRESFLFCFLVGYSNKRKGQFGNLGQTNWRHFQRAARSLSSFGSCLSIMYPRLTLPASLTCQLGQERESVGEVEPGSLSGSIEPIWFGLLPIYIYIWAKREEGEDKEREREGFPLFVPKETPRGTNGGIEWLCLSGCGEDLVRWKG